MEEILNRTELQDLTGYSSIKKMEDWLKKNRIPYILAGNGIPKVNRHALAYLMGAPVEKPKKTIEKRKGVP